MSARAWSAFLLATLLLAACSGILGIKPKDEQRPFAHHAHSVAGVGCTSCHANVARAPAAGELDLPPATKCLECHARPHDTRPCAMCHGERAARDEAVLAKEHLRFAHDRHVARLGGQCVPCHAAAGKADATTLRPAMAECLGCHAHKDQWRTRECDACHVDLPAERIVPSSHVIHEGDFLREHGVRAAAGKELCATCHEESACAKCHGVTTAALPWKLAFDKPSLSGLHRAGFLARHPDEARANPGACTTCHDSERFCQDCHTRRRAVGPGRNPHPPDWVRARGGQHGLAARMDPMSCASCHGGAGESLCIGCHRVGGPGGNPHGRGFSSALDRRHDEPCRRCHTS